MIGFGGIQFGRQSDGALAGRTLDLVSTPLFVANNALVAKGAVKCHFSHNSNSQVKINGPKFKTRVRQTRAGLANRQAVQTDSTDVLLFISAVPRKKNIEQPQTLRNLPTPIRIGLCVLAVFQHCVDRYEKEKAGNLARFPASKRQASF
jgi:hypothetical protein